MLHELSREKRHDHDRRHTGHGVGQQLGHVAVVVDFFLHHPVHDAGNDEDDQHQRYDGFHPARKNIFRRHEILTALFNGTLR